MPYEKDFYKNIIDNLYDDVYFVDRDRVITYWNKGAERITGYPAGQTVGRSCRDNLLNHVTANGIQLCMNYCPLADVMEDGREREAPLERSVDELWSALWRSQRGLAAGPQTLLHGDTHIGNAYLLPDGTGGFYDWQLMARGHWANDLAFLLCSGIVADVRREHERGLIDHYLATLADAGVKEPPTPQEAWECYRLAAIWGLVIGWLITPPVNYGVEITAANISRMVAATIDLASLDAAY